MRFQFNRGIRVHFDARTLEKLSKVSDKGLKRMLKIWNYKYKESRIAQKFLNEQKIELHEDAHRKAGEIYSLRSAIFWTLWNYYHNERKLKNPFNKNN